MANKRLECKQCKEYHPAEEMTVHPIGKFCSYDCVIEFIRTKQEADTKRKLAKAKQDTKKAEKAVREKLRKDKERVKPLSKSLAEAQAVINRYVRLRDAKKGCVSCDKPATWQGQWHCSHFHPRGRSSKLRFNLWNMHKSCSVCNSHLSGNLRQYEPELIKRIGIDKFNWMEENASVPTKYNAEYLKRLKKIFSKRAKRYQSSI